MAGGNANVGTVHKNSGKAGVRSFAQQAAAKPADRPTARLRGAIYVLMILALGLMFCAGAMAQGNSANPLIAPGNGVVTGFSGAASPYQEANLPEGSAALDETFIDLSGASMRALELEGLRIGDESLTSALQLHEVSAREIGQVFGVALDDATLPSNGTPAPNIYLTATSAYGLHIVSPDADGDGLPERVSQGGADVQWMAGLFGAENGGGPGSIWKVDGVSGEVTLFATIAHEGTANSGPALGNIAFDARTRQLFVSDRDTGMIHRLDLQGEIKGTFDHGLTARPLRNLEPVAHDAAKRADITSAAFKSDDPATWGMASLPRRTWGLAVHNRRLYYAVAEGPQIWSIGIERDGSFGDYRWEVDLPSDAEPYEVSDIAFTGRGRMVLAQRAAVTGSNDYRQPVQSGGARVLRFRLETPPNPETPSRWLVEADEYPVGQLDQSRASDGGLAIGFGYTRTGALNYRACRATLWTTGSGLKTLARQSLDPRPAAARPEAELFLDGLQGSTVTLVRPENVPPKLARFADFDGVLGEQAANGQLGDIEIPILCQPETPYVPPAPPPPVGLPVLDLGIDKRQIGQCTIAGICSFELAITNRGSQTYRGPLTISDQVSQSGLALVGYGAAPWSCLQAGTEVSCQRPNLVLHPGRSTSLYLDFRLLAKILIPGYNNCGTVSWLGNANDAGTIKGIQIALADMGFYAGPIDGLMTPATNQAISDYEIAWGRPATGVITPWLLDKLYGPGLRPVGDANPANDRDCADVEFIAGPGPWVGPGPIGPWPAGLDVTIGGPAECIFGQPCSFGLTVRNTRAVPFDMQIDGIVDLKRLGVAVPEQILNVPGFCGGPINQMDINCGHSLQLGPNQARSYPLRLDIQNALLDPTNAANRGPDGQVRGNICFRVKDQGWFGGWFAQTLDEDCHEFIVPEAAPEIAEPEDDDWINVGGLEFAKKGPASCRFMDECTFNVTFRNTTAQPIQGVDLWDMAGRTGGPNGGLGLPMGLTITSVAPSLCNPELNSTVPDANAVARCVAEFNLPAGATRTHAITLRIDHPGLDPIVEGHQGDDGKVWLQNCFLVRHDNAQQRSCTVVPLESPEVAGPEAQEPPEEEDIAQPEDDGWVAVGDIKMRKTGPASCQFLGECTFNLTLRNPTASAVENIELFEIASRASDPTGQTHLPKVLPISRIQPQLCNPELNTTFARDLPADRRSICTPGIRLAAGETREHAVTLRIDSAEYDPRNAANRGEQGEVWLRSCSIVIRADGNVSSCVVVPVTAPNADPPPNRPLEPRAGRFGPQLSVNKVAGSRSCRANGDCRFAITVVNNGIAPYQGPLEISEQMEPKTSRLLAATPSPWDCSGANGKYTCRHPNLTLDVGQSKTVNLTFRMPNAAPGDVRNCANFAWANMFNGRTVAAKQALRAMDFDPGADNPRLTAKAQQAIRAFQRRQGMRVSGAIDGTLMQALISNWGVGDQNAGDDNMCVGASFIKAPRPVDPGPIVTPITCPRGQFFDPKLQRCRTRCASGTVFDGKQCVSRCSASQRWDARANRCVNRCSSSQRWDGQRCANRCAAGQVWNERTNRCVNRCSSSQRWDGKQCVSRCSASQRWDARANRCVNRCSSSQRWNGKQCVSRCSASQRWDSRRNRCVNRCSSSQRWNGKQCVSRCSGGKVFDAKRNRCVCPSGKTEIRGQCVTMQVTPGGQTTSPGPSVVPSTPNCRGGKVYDAKRRACVCPRGQIDVRGKCQVIQIRPNQTIRPNPTIQPQLIVPKR